MTGSGYGGHALRLRDAQGGDEAPALDEIQQQLKSIKIEIRSEGNRVSDNVLADALLYTVDKVLHDLLPKWEWCSEEPDSVRYASGVGFVWIRTTYCWGRVLVGNKKYHVYVDYTQGYNSSKSEAQLKSIELIQHSKVARDD
jgi:hypothetical protein